MKTQCGPYLLGDRDWEAATGVASTAAASFFRKSEYSTNRMKGTISQHIGQESILR